MLFYWKLFRPNALQMTQNALEIKHRKARPNFFKQMKRLVFRKGKVLGSNRIRIGNRPKKPFCCVDDDACLETCPRHRVSCSSAKVHTHTTYTHSILMSAWCGAGRHFFMEQ